MKGITPEEKRDLILSVGTHKSSRRLTPVQVATRIQKSVVAGESLENISTAISLSESVIRSFISLLSLPEEVQYMVGWGSDPTTIAFSSAVELARLENKENKSILAKAVLENELSLRDVTQIVQINKRSGKSIQESIEAVLDQRPIIEKRHMIIGRLTAPVVIQYISNLNKNEQNDFLANSLKKYGPGKPTHGSKLQDNFFIISCDDQYFQAINSIGVDIETSVTSLLKKEINSRR